MAIGAGAAGAWAATNATTHAVTLPAHAAGNLLVVIAACKAGTITTVAQVVTIATGWTRAGAFADGTTNSGVGTGSVNQAVFWKVATSSSETNPVVSWGGANTATPGIAVGLCFTKAGGETWMGPEVVQAATTNATSISVTMGSNPGITAGDWGIAVHTTRDDSALTVPTWTATGTTLAAAVVFPTTPIASGTSNDMAGTAAYRSVTSGTASAAPVVTGTQAVAETGVTGFIRLRVYTGTPLYPHSENTLLSSAYQYSTGTNDPMLSGSTRGWFASGLLTARDSFAGGQETALNTVNGPTSGVEYDNGTSSVHWLSLPLDADVTISGAIAWNIWANESLVTAEATIQGVLDVIDGATGTITEIDRTTRAVELHTSPTLHSWSETPSSGVACKRGDRLRVRIFADDAAASMVTGHTVSYFVYGDTAYAIGDTWIGLTESVTFGAHPSGTRLYLTDTTSPVSTAALDKEAWTSRGAGVIQTTYTTVNGWTAPVQVIDTIGGTAIDWWTRQLVAFTLGGMVFVNVRGSGGTVSLQCEIARVDSDGSNPTVWGKANQFLDLNTTEDATLFYVSGDDLAISEGQRLRIRLYYDDLGAIPMASGSTAKIFYAGTSGGASGDSYLIFTQTLTEYVAVANPPRSRQIPQLLAH